MQRKSCQRVVRLVDLSVGYLQLTFHMFLYAELNISLDVAQLLSIGSLLLTGSHARVQHPEFTLSTTRFVMKEPSVLMCIWHDRFACNCTVCKEAVIEVSC